MQRGKGIGEVIQAGGVELGEVEACADGVRRAGALRAAGGDGCRGWESGGEGDGQKSCKSSCEEGMHFFFFLGRCECSVEDGWSFWQSLRRRDDDRVLRNE